MDARLLMYAAGLDDGASRVRPGRPSPGAAAAGQPCTSCGRCGGGGGGAGFLETAARSLSRVGSAVLLGSRPASPGPPALPPAVEVTACSPPGAMEPSKRTSRISIIYGCIFDLSSRGPALAVVVQLESPPDGACHLGRLGRP